MSQVLYSAPVFLQYLIENNKITSQVADRVTRVQRETSDKLANILLKLGLLSEADLASQQIAFLQLEKFDSEQLPESTLS